MLSIHIFIYIIPLILFKHMYIYTHNLLLYTYLFFILITLIIHYISVYRTGVTPSELKKWRWIFNIVITKGETRERFPHSIL